MAKVEFNIGCTWCEHLKDWALSRASIVGTATETVIRLLSEFKSDGLVSFEGKKIRVLEPKKLAKQADLILA